MGVQTEGKTGEIKLRCWGKPLGGTDNEIFSLICFYRSALRASPKPYFCQGWKPDGRDKPAQARLAI